MTPAPQIYVQRHGFRETIMVLSDETDEYGDPVYRPATVEEEHQQWVEETLAERGFQ